MRVFMGVFVGAMAVLPATPALAVDAAVVPATQRLKAATDAVAAASPTDAALTGLSDADLVARAVRCTALDGRTYCLQLGWVDRAPTHDELRDKAAAGAAAAAAAAAGDLPLAAKVRQWAKQPHHARVAGDRAELDAARQALGKVKLYEEHLLARKPVARDFWRKYPETATWGKPLAARAGLTDGGVSAQVVHYAAVGDPNRGQKQVTSYYCGPSSMVAFAWNDPRRRDELSPANGYTQDWWAKNRLGTTTDGTAITSLVANINEHLTWKDWVGAYVVVGIAGWSDQQWIDMWRWHIPNGGPVQLHPNLDPGNNSYGMDTSGHFNVGRGFNFDPNASTWYISVYESAGGSRVPVSYWETHRNVIDANRNHPMKNIGY